MSLFVRRPRARRARIPILFHNPLFHILKKLLKK